ncbi:MAG TPA: RNA polymerase sigma factor [Candidatus Krumholzibacteria bacterium]|nr:RNA polymerase sigma factor [Candidatus Krumholzibacteria bacterium]
MSNDQDRELVARSLRGDGRAFRDLVGKHHATAYAVVRAILGPQRFDDVDDVMQLTYLKAYQGLGSFRGESKFSTWLYQIARREALDVVSKKRVDTTSIDDVEIPARADATPDAATHERGERERIERAMAELDESYRTAIELRYMAEKSYEEIAELMRLPVGTVKTYVHRGKLELKKILSRPAWRERKDAVS